MEEHEQILKHIYYNPEAVGSFGGVNSLFQEARKQSKTLSRKHVRDWLSEQDAYTLHKQARIHFKRNKTVVPGLDAQWQADLVDMQHFSKYNEGYKYILTVVDILSKYAWARCLKDKTGRRVADAFHQIFTGGRIPCKLQTDAGKEFLNKHVRELLKKYRVHHFVTNNEVKAAIVERFNRTLKSKMWRYFTAKNTFRYVTVLPRLIKSYNQTFHRVIKMRPVDVTQSNALYVWGTVYGDTASDGKEPDRFREGDHVRVSKLKGVFEKGYEQSFTDEVFIVDQLRASGRRPVYLLRDYAGEKIIGSFYPEELQKVKGEDRVYRIEKILATKGRGQKKQHLVKWLGWPDKFNSWVADKELSEAT